jgi:hypothetical protein
LPNAPNYHTKITSRRQQYNLFDRPSNSSSSGSSSSSSTSKSTVSSSSSTITAATATTTNTSAAVPTAIEINTKPIVTLFTPSTTMTNAIHNNSSQHTFALFPNDAIVTVQLYVTAALSLFVSVMTWQYYFDWDQLHEDVSKLPLQSGTSTYCHVVCPELIQRQQQLTQNNLYIPITTTVATGTSTSPMQTNNDTPNTKDAAMVKIVQLSTQELWNDPVSENLQRMVQLVHNCQQRVQYETYCRDHQVHLVQQQQQLQQIQQLQHNTDMSESLRDNVILVDVPEPSLPLRYHTIPSTTSTIAAAATANVYDAANHNHK